jgi:hypothetical protein
METTYLGDGAYVEWTGYSFCIYTTNGMERTNEVFLEPAHLENLYLFKNEIMKQRNIKR